ncbi:carbohydrate kinase [Marinitoga arctica]
MFLSIGEVLIDMITESVSLYDATVFQRFFGGSPANIAINVAKQGIDSFLLSSIGKDPFGKFIEDFLLSNNVKLNYLVKRKDVYTDIVFVNKSKETPEFSAYRNASLKIDIPKSFELNKFKIIHISSWAVSEKNQFEKILELVKKAKKYGIYIGFDPNYREILWNNTYSIVDILKILGPYIDFIKPSFDDAESIFGKGKIEDYLKYFEELKLKNIIFSLGKDGVLLKTKNDIIKLPSYAKEVVDVTGAGDAVWSGLYIGLLNGLSILDSTKLGLSFAAEKLKYTGAIAPIKNWNLLKEIYHI